jgi:hypothetical protein
LPAEVSLHNDCKHAVEIIIKLDTPAADLGSSTANTAMVLQDFEANWL